MPCANEALDLAREVAPSKTVSPVIALWRLVETGHSTINGMNQPLEPALSQVLPRFESTIDAASCLAVLGALCDRTVELHPHLEALGVSVPEHMPAEVARLTAEVRALRAT